MYVSGGHALIKMFDALVPHAGDLQALGGCGLQVMQ